MYNYARVISHVVQYLLYCTVRVSLCVCVAFIAVTAVYIRTKVTMLHHYTGVALIAVAVVSRCML